MSVSIAAIAKDVLTVASAVKVASGAFLHKAYQWIVAEYKKAKAAEAKVVADVKKDL